MPRVLVVDDEPGVRESLRMLLAGECEVVTAPDVESALRALAVTPPDLILLDLVMPGRSGFDLLAELSDRGNMAPVVVLTASTTVNTAVEAMKHGAADFITKPFELEALRIKVRQLLEHRALEEEVARLRTEVQDRQQLAGLLGRSEAMRSVFRSIERIAMSKASVLITGESGTGKELAARAIHELSPRARGPFVAINCGAMATNLIESELFGHERGAFTDAVERRIGRFEAASGGTLLLDEVGDLEPTVQVKLLRALQERCIERLGGSETIKVDVRVVAATHRDLDREVEEGRFRSDLYYRIKVVPISLPPLRERREDIRVIATHFLARLSEEHGVQLSLSRGAWAALEAHAWPGNVRELENALEHGAALCAGAVIGTDALPDAIKSGGAAAVSEEWRSGRIDFEETLTRFESGILLEALQRSSWNQTRAARDLGITRRLLKLKMDRFGLKPPER